MEQREGSLLGGILMVSGCCIGAGMLGLPVLSSLSGFIPSSFVFVICWAFMLVTGLLLLEVNLYFKGDVSLISMAGKTLGVFGKILTWLLFLFLFYSILIAYVSGTGTLFTEVMEWIDWEVAPWVGSLIITLFFGVMLYLGTVAVDYCNRILMVGLIISYVALVSLGVTHMQPYLLLHSNWAATLLVVPVMIISFGYHNMIPTLKTYLNGNVRKLFLIFFIGTLIPLLVYLIWDAVILGIVPLGGFQGALDQGEMATRALKATVDSSAVQLLSEHLAFFAIVSSYVTVAISFVDFLSDGLGVQKVGLRKLFLCFLTLFPPFLLAFIYPGLFLMALHYAGAFGAVILFGILPAIMVWRGRYYLKVEGTRIVPGGRFTLSLVIVFALFIILLTLANELDLLDIV